MTGSIHELNGRICSRTQWMDVFSDSMDAFVQNQWMDMFTYSIDGHVHRLSVYIC